MSSKPFRPVTLLVELARIACVLPLVEWRRRVDGPAPLVERLRRLGRRARRRSVEDRGNLQRVIAAVDRRLPGEPSCYRRVLLEMALDAGAAEDELHLGLRVPGGPRSGHAWLGSRHDGDGEARMADPTGRPRGYDVQLDM